MSSIFFKNFRGEQEKIVNEIKGEESERKPIEHKNIRGKEYFK